MFCISKEISTNIENILDNEYKKIKKKKNKEIINYLNIIASFDIETSSFYIKKEKQAIMYAYGIGINGKVKIGRTWDEFLEDINKIIKYYNINLSNRLIIWVHNLSYEFQWIRKKFEWHNVFSLDTREVVYAITKEGIEFRCSYVLSGYGLEMLGEKLVKYKVEKLVGYLDYNLIRSPITPMSKEELEYLRNDNLVVMAYIKERIDECKSLIYLPLTKTGYVRAYCRKNTVAVKENKSYRKLIHSLTIDPTMYMLLQNAFAGGFTHANALWNNGICKDVYSNDLTSSYPTIMCSEKFPMSVGRKIKIYDEKGLNYVLEKYCCLLDVTYKNINEYFKYDHYISESKCIKLENKLVDNGRVVKAKNLRIIITEVDFNIIKKTYKYTDLEINSCYIFKKGYLPKEFIGCILHFYEQKTVLKDVKGKEAEYSNIKEMLNSCYGMCVTDPCRDVITYSNNNFFKEIPNIEDTLNTYNLSHNRFLYYAWGVWVTAYGRNNLWKAIYAIGKDYIYSDTDSVKYFNKEKYNNFFIEYNKDITNKIYDCLNSYGFDTNLAHPKNIKGLEKPLGIWDYEGKYDYFKTLGAKRYMYVKDNDLGITIAGVSKKNGKEYLLYKFKTPYNALLNFDINLEFPAQYKKDDKKDGKKDNKIYNGSGKMTHTYIDDEIKGIVIDYLGNKYNYKEDSCIHLEATSYTLSLSQEYLDYLMNIDNEFYIDNKIKISLKEV